MKERSKTDRRQRKEALYAADRRKEERREN